MLTCKSYYDSVICLLDCFSGRPIGFLLVSLHIFYNSILTLYTVFPALYHTYMYWCVIDLINCDLIRCEIPYVTAVQEALELMRALIYRMSLVARWIRNCLVNTTLCSV